MLALVSLELGAPQPWIQARSLVCFNSTVDGVNSDNLINSRLSSPIPTDTPQALSIPPKKKRISRPIDPFRKEQEAELLRTTAQLGVGIAIMSTVYTLLGEPLNLSVLLGPILAKLFTGPLGDLGNKLSLLFIPKLAKSNLQKGVQLKSAYQKQRAHFSVSMRGFMDVNLQRYFHEIEHFNYVNKPCERAIEEVLQLPLFPKKVDTRTIPALKAFLQNYPERVRIAVSSFVVQTIKDATSRKLSKKAVPLMLVGPPGTGKTHLATHLGQLLSLPTQVIDISKYKSLAGHSFWSQDPERGSW
jgi:hypothetical protein